MYAKTPQMRTRKNRALTALVFDFFCFKNTAPGDFDAATRLRGRALASSPRCEPPVECLGTSAGMVGCFNESLSSSSSSSSCLDGCRGQLPRLPRMRARCDKWALFSFVWSKRNQKFSSPPSEFQKFSPVPNCPAGWNCG